MICPYRKGLTITNNGGYQEMFNECVEVECPYYTSLLTHCCWKVQMEIDAYQEAKAIKDMKLKGGI